jgi:hypothetical protein
LNEEARLRHSPKSTLLVVFVALAADVVFLRAMWIDWSNWGIWDWDFQWTLLEAARRSLVEYGQLPRWNPWLGGGHSLVGHPLGRTFNPSFLPVLAFGTVAGTKVCILVYLLLGQVGTYLLARQLELSRLPAAFAALLVSWGGCYAQHLTHGHFEWIAYSWVPWVVLFFERAFRGRGTGALLLASVFLALTWLDGGPYQLAFVPLFLGVWAAARALEAGSPRPLLLLALGMVLAAALASIQLAPVLETVLRYPRSTLAQHRLVGVSEQWPLLDVFHQAFVARSQSHEVDVAMPLRINAGAYVGVVPLLFAMLALVLELRRAAVVAAVLGFSLLLMLSDQLPVGPWALLHQLPGFSSLMVPLRFNFFVLFCIALLAATGLSAVERRWGGPRLGRAILLSVFGFVAADLLLVNGAVFAVAFCVPPVETREPGSFVQDASSPYAGRYAETATRPVWPNWPNATFPTIHENRGVVLSYFDLPYPRSAIPRDHPRYPGAEVWSTDGRSSVRLEAWSPNTVTVAVDGPGGRLVLNQNYDPGWRLLGGRGGGVLAHAGRVAVDVGPGTRTVTVSYRPISFAIGAGITLGALIATACGLLARRRG